MDYSQYETYDFDHVSAFNMSTGFKERSYKMHWHSYGEILLVGPGKTNIYKVGKSTYELVPDDIVLVWPMEMHAIVDADREKALVIQFSNSFMNSLFDLQRIMHMYRNLHIICVEAHPELAAKLKAITEKMKDIFFSDNQEKEIRCCMLLMEFMLTLLEHRNELAPELSEEPYGYADDVMQRMMMVTDYIRNNLTADDLSQGSMAEMAGISKDYFSRIFKNATGMNYSKWLNMIRLEKASELLTEEGRTLTEIAMLSGFQSIPSFNRVFREEKGMTPRDYRALFVRRSE
ncbi:MULTISPECIES: AraC family transcriptional regulator [unclassified Butyrivibrio]|uniref:helix-turn-helix domain-containing protein n=1 Tax=unclassified Butyrivibrio TaxID=2639466 RepID=UPI0003B2F099|nr:MULTISPECIES: AraC family transcriptional regulator [unclassified Butyrivibrio]SDB57601.1 AraC-type DNA-binding protein [Butyrivibrio sp. INlla16]SEL84957.1 AraC-type DNA-binding protein [Butyrivibrio sp. ob235]